MILILKSSVMAYIFYEHLWFVKDACEMLLIICIDGEDGIVLFFQVVKFVLETFKLRTHTNVF